MALSPPSSCTVPSPTRDEAEALCHAEAYLSRAGTQVASRLLGCPEPNREAAIDADFSNALLRGAALCAALGDVAPADDRRGL